MSLVIYLLCFPRDALSPVGLVSKAIIRYAHTASVEIKCANNVGNTFEVAQWPKVKTAKISSPVEFCITT